jgi:hypothetical protein
MFLKDALLRCSQLEDEVASIYATLAKSPTVASESAAAWAEAARRERSRSQMLHALAELSAALGDDGPFLVQIPVQLANLRRIVDTVRGRITPALDAATADRCADTLEGAQRSELHATLLEVVEPEIRRVLKLVEAETRAARRGSPASRAKEAQRRAARAGAKDAASDCAPPAAAEAAQATS